MSFFNYFAYGSNLLSNRIKINNSSAKPLAIGLLKNYKFFFSGYSELWKGAVANIEQCENESLFGMVWVLNNDDLPNLDAQEKNYERILVNVILPDDSTTECWTYVQSKKIMNFDLNDIKSKPSAMYKKIIIKGLLENKFSEEYIAKIKILEDNGILDCGPNLHLENI